MNYSTKVRIGWALYIALVISVLAFCAAVMSGCVSTDDGGWRLTFGAADRIEKGLDAGSEGLGLVSLFVPGLAGFAGIGAGIAGAFKKLKPQLTQNKEVADHVVTSIEKIKKDYPETWENIKDVFKEKTNADIDITIAKIIALQESVEEAKTAG